MYKPEYLGKVIPAEDQIEMTDFIQNKYKAFSKIYDVCKEYSSNIDNISIAEKEGNEMNALSIKISASDSTMEIIRSAAQADEALKIKNNVITAIV